MTLDKKDFKMNMSRDKFNMLATFTGDKYLFCQSSLAQAVLIDRLRSNFCGAYHERINITSVQAYICLLYTSQETLIVRLLKR